MTLPLPWNLSQSKAVWHPVNVSRSGGASLNGSEQIIQSNSGHWGCSLEIPVYHEEKILAYRAFIAGMEGRGTEILVPCMSKFRPVDFNGRMFPMENAAPLVLSELAGFGQTETAVMWTAEPAAMGSRQLFIRHPQQPPLRPGHYFGIGDRLHLISAAWSVDQERVSAGGSELTFGSDALTYGAEALLYGDQMATVSGENLQGIRFWPALREATPAGAPLILGRPVCKMRLAADDSGMLDLEHDLYGTASLEFREVY